MTTILLTEYSNIIIQGYKINIIIETNEYTTGTLYYNITYTYNNEKEKHILESILYNNIDFDMDGVFIVKNDITDKMISILLYNDMDNIYKYYDHNIFKLVYDNNILSTISQLDNIVDNFDYNNNTGLSEKNYYKTQINKCMKVIKEPNNIIYLRNNMMIAFTYLWGS